MLKPKTCKTNRVSSWVSPWQESPLGLLLSAMATSPSQYAACISISIAGNDAWQMGHSTLVSVTWGLMAGSSSAVVDLWSPRALTSSTSGSTLFSISSSSILMFCLPTWLLLSWMFPSDFRSSGAVNSHRHSVLTWFPKATSESLQAETLKGKISRSFH